MQNSVSTTATQESHGDQKETNTMPESDIKVTYLLHDINGGMVNAWKKLFESYSDRVKVSKGDIFQDGPAADAIVSPANSFGFMDGGIDMVYSLHFGWQMQERLQEVIRSDHDGELLVGNAIIIPSFKDGIPSDENDWSKFNEGEPIKYLISAPTMRVPLDVSQTMNAYLAFRAVILAVKKHNKQLDKEPIRRVLCPGLGTAVGMMPPYRCAYQMRLAFETYELGMHNPRIHPDSLRELWKEHEKVSEISEK